METRYLTLGVVQMDSKVGNISANLERAEELINVTARQGAQIVLTPELMPCGYTLTEAIWNYAEPFEGQTVSWLTRLAKQLRIFLGTSFLEACGEDFYNTFVLPRRMDQWLGRSARIPRPHWKPFSTAGRTIRM